MHVLHMWKNENKHCFTFLICWVLGFSDDLSDNLKKWFFMLIIHRRLSVWILFYLTFIKCKKMMTSLTFNQSLRITWIQNLATANMINPIIARKTPLCIFINLTDAIIQNLIVLLRKHFWFFLANGTLRLQDSQRPLKNSQV